MKKKKNKKDKELLEFVIHTLEEFFNPTNSEQLDVIYELKKELKEYE